MTTIQTKTVRETAEENMLAELAQVERYSHEQNYHKLHINRDGSVSWFECISKSDDLIDRDADRFAPIPSVITVGTGSIQCDCPFCSEVYDEKAEKLAEEQGRKYDRSAKYKSYQDAITAAISDADLTEYERQMIDNFWFIPDTGYFEDEAIAYKFDRAMCGDDFDGDIDAVAAYLTGKGYPSVAVTGSYNGAPSEESQAKNGALIPSEDLFFEAVAAASDEQ